MLRGAKLAKTTRLQSVKHPCVAVFTPFDAVLLTRSRGLVGEEFKDKPACRLAIDVDV